MNPNTAHNPVFLVFPPEITIPDVQPTDLTAPTFESKSAFPKLLATKMKILGVSQIFPNGYSTEDVLWTVCVPNNS